jgi:hypothetical protein
MLSPRPTSERRAAAARANGAKSRGPSTTQGKINSSANSKSHGLRSHAPSLIDADALRHFADLLASYEDELKPASPIERRLIQTMASADVRLTCLRKLETQTYNREIARLKLLTPDADSLSLMTRAFVFLVDNTCFVEMTARLETRFERQFDTAFETFKQHQAWRREIAGNRIFSKVKMDERTQQAAENTERPPRRTQLGGPQCLALAARTQ